MLYLIGLGLSDLEDITLKGLNAIKSSDHVYLEHYTSVIGNSKEQLEEFYGRPITLADRDLVEQDADRILNEARHANVSFLVVGDPLGATTHSDLVLRACQRQIPYKVIHNASILNASGCCGLQLYSFGETVSICFWSKEFQPRSYMHKVNENFKRGLHTLCLLDIKVKERSIENLIKGRDIYEPARFMSVIQASEQMCRILAQPEDNEDFAFNEHCICVALARVGQDTQSIVVSTLSGMMNQENALGEPLHSLIVAGRLHPMEEEFLEMFFRKRENEDDFKTLIQRHNSFF